MARWMRWTGGAVVALGAVAAVGVSQLLPETETVLTLQPRPASGLVISDVRVVDVVSGTTLDHRDVHIDGTRITAIEDHDPIVRGDHVVDGRGATLVPGLIDAHVHVFSSSNAPGHVSLPAPELAFQRLLYSGVTTVFDPGSDPGEAFPMRDALAEGSVVGPTLYAAGPIFTAPGGHPVPMVEEMAPSFLVDTIAGRLTRQVGTVDEATAEVDALVPDGPDFIKLAIDRIPLQAPRLDPKVAKAVVDAANAHGLRTVAHIGTVQDALDAADAGVLAWVHGVYQESIPEDDIARLAAHGIPMVPTMAVFRSYSQMGRGRYDPTPLEQALAPDALFASWVDPALADIAPPEVVAFTELLRQHQRSALDNVGRLHRAGVRILAGSDSQSGMLPGPSLHRELALLQEAGLTPLEVLQAATVHNARFLEDSADPSFGIVAVGKRADLVLVEGDPLTDVSALADIRAVIVRGRLAQRTPWPRP